MNGLELVAAGHYLPQKILTNEMLSQMVETNDEWISKRTGIKTRHLCENESNLDLAYQAAEMALSQANIDRQKIAVVIVTTFTGDYYTPAMANILAGKLKLRESVMAFDINVACSSFAYAVKLAQSLLAEDNESYALVIGSEELSKVTDFTDRSSCILFGDGAGAVLLKRKNGLFYSQMGTKSDVETLYCGGAGHENRYIQMQGQEVFKFAISVLPKTIDELLAQANLTMDDIAWVICHQANQRIIENVARKYKANEKFFVNIDRYGNTSSASIPIAISELLQAEKLHKGDKIISVGFGAGLAWGGVLWEA